jgi:hypothetical protein
MARNSMIRTSWAILLLCFLIGCSSANTPRVPPEPDALVKGNLTEDNVRQALQAKLAKQIKYLEENRDRFKKEVVEIPSSSTTYYFKYYDVFPEGPDKVDVTVTPGEPFSAPYTANAEYRKVRYQTRYTKSEGRASSDTDFIRDEGIQKDVYDFNSGAWQLRSSVFEVTKTSIYRNERWTPTLGRIKRVEEEKPEYFIDKVRSLFGLLD